MRQKYQMWSNKIKSQPSVIGVYCGYMNSDNTQKIFEDVYTAHRDAVYRFVFFRVRDIDVVEDITQTVFIKMYEKIRSGDVPHNPSSYLFTIARNTVIDYWRKKKSLSLEAYLEYAPEPEDTGPTPEGVSMSRESQELVEKLLATLSHEQRDILVMKYVTDLSNKEIAEITGKTEESIRQIQSRALRTLRSRLSTHE